MVSGTDPRDIDSPGAPPPPSEAPPASGSSPPPPPDAAPPPSGDPARARADFLRVMTEDRIDFLFRYLHSRGVGAADAQDIVQEVLLIVFLGQTDFDAQRIDALAWLSTIARRTATRRRERPHNRREALVPPEYFEDAPDDAPTPEHQAILNSRRQFLLDLFDRLSPDQRSVIEAHDMLGMTFEEIADLLGMPFGTVANHYRVGKGVLKAAAKQWQALQSRRKLPLTPIVLAPFLSARRAWAAGSRSLRGSLGLAIAAVASLTLWSATTASGEEHAAASPRSVAAVTPARADAEVVSPLATAAPRPMPVPDIAPKPIAPDTPRAPVAPHLPAAPPALSRKPSNAERLLLLQARTAIDARSYAVARQLLEQHARSVPRGQLAAERQALRARLSALSPSAPPR
ncbi:MAG TPA: sigma-70 family RNA polymerase sigma factor [Candidatus Nanopelagicales bacterium]|nr:sigma-70 family RNA polymerase sigma factor [Candidatus Nanopelagicales bacterium]